jgi:hypothetical protein
VIPATQRFCAFSLPLVSVFLFWLIQGISTNLWMCQGYQQTWESKCFFLLKINFHTINVVNFLEFLSYTYQKYYLKTIFLFYKFYLYKRFKKNSRPVCLDLLFIYLFYIWKVCPPLFIFKNTIQKTANDMSFANLNSKPPLLAEKSSNTYFV